VTLLGFSHEAMSARKLLEEALADAPYEVNGFCYTADEFKALGFSDVLIAVMKDGHHSKTRGQRTRKRPPPHDDRPNSKERTSREVLL